MGWMHQLLLFAEHPADEPGMLVRLASLRDGDSIQLWWAESDELMDTVHTR